MEFASACERDHDSLPIGYIDTEYSNGKAISGTWRIEARHRSAAYDLPGSGPKGLSSSLVRGNNEVPPSRWQFPAKAPGLLERRSMGCPVYLPAPYSQVDSRQLLPELNNVCRNYTHDGRLPGSVGMALRTVISRSGWADTFGRCEGRGVKLDGRVPKLSDQVNFATVKMERL